MENSEQFQMSDQELLTYDPIVLVLEVLRRWLLIVVVAVMVSVCAYVISDSTYTPVYQSNATLVVTIRGSTGTVYNNLTAASELASVFTEVLNSSLMRKTIMQELNLTQFNGTITASAVEATNLLNLQVRASDPRTAFLVIQALIEHHEMVTYDVMGDIIVEVLQHPSVPSGPVNVNNPMALMKRALVLSAVAVAAIILFLSFMRDSVRSRLEAEKKLNCWCLGEIHHETKSKTFADWLKHRNKSILITRPEADFRYVSTIGKLRRRVEQHMRGSRVMMVTSVLENEGKSTVAVNLALAMSRKYSKVLLIDSDFRKPACRKILDLGKPEGSVQDVVLGNTTLADAVMTDRLSRLHILCAQRISAQNVGDLISSEGMAKLIEQARLKYDFVIIDLPPMSVSSDSECMMEYADASLLVVRQNGATAGALNRAIDVLSSGKSKLLGCVLNNVHATYISSGEGYQNAYSRYGSYGKYGRYGKYGKYGRYGAYASSMDTQEE